MRVQQIQTLVSPCLASPTAPDFRQWRVYTVRLHTGLDEQPRKNPLDRLYLCGHNRSVKQALRSLRWIGSAKKDLLAMPDEVQQRFGFALYHAQTGLLYPAAKPLKGFGSAGILEIVEDWRGNAYRAVYTVRFAEAVYVLHCFQKKSKHGIETPKPEMDLIRARLKEAEMQAKGGQA